MSRITRKLRRVIGMFETCCGHGELVEKACQEEAQLRGLIEESIEAAEDRGFERGASALSRSGACE